MVGSIMSGWEGAEEKSVLWGVTDDDDNESL